MIGQLIQSILNEGRDAPLYHGTSLSYLEKILSSNRLNQSDEFQRISFTRSFKHSMDWGDGIVIAFDQNKLRQKFGKKLQPTHYWEADEVGIDEDEEALFDVRFIENIKSYIIGIYLRKNHSNHHVKFLKILQKNGIEDLLNKKGIVPKNWFLKYIGKME